MRRSIDRLFFTLVLVSILALSGCSKMVSPTPETRLILKDGVMDIPVLEGSFKTNDCGSISGGLEAEEYVCVAFPVASEGVDGKDWDDDYSGALHKEGWKFAGGESIAFYFEKPIDENCSHKLNMLGWYQGTPRQDKIYAETGELQGIENMVFIFALDEEPVCGDKRQAS